jgi:hypothetical protein
MVVMCAYVVEISFPRFSVGWYAGRVGALLSGTLVLVVLPYEITIRSLNQMLPDQTAR